MIKLSSRQLDLFRKLINRENIKVKDFAQKYNISVRTVYREIDNINKEIQTFGVKVANADGGLVLNGDSEQLIHLKLNIPGIDSVMKVQNKKNLILLDLLQGKGPIKIQYFAKKFNVSSATISYYLKDIKEWLESKNIILVSKPGVGIYIESDEGNIRHAIIDLLYQTYSADELVSFLQEGYEHQANPTSNKLNNELNDRLLNMMDHNTLKVIEKALTNLATEMNYQIEDRLYIELAIHLALAIKRLLNGETIDIQNSTLEKLKESGDYIYAEKIARSITSDLPIEIPEAEIGYITIHLQGVRIGTQALQVDDQFLTTMTNKIIQKASVVFGINFREDQTLYKDLKSHLLYSVYRLKNGFKIRNPLIQQIKNQYKTVFKQCKLTLDKTLREDLNLEINDDEIGYITMHFLASLERLKNKTRKINALLVCASGIGTSRMLMAKLKKIPQLNVVTTASVLKINEMKETFDLDVIISTVPIQRDDIKVVIVNPLFTESDLEKLEGELNVRISVQPQERKIEFEKDQLSQLKYIKDYSSQISVLTKNVCFTTMSSTQVNCIIKGLLNELVEKKLLNRQQALSLRQTLLDREKLGAIIIPKKNFAIYHCASSEITEPMIAVARLDKPANLINLLGKNEKVTTAFLMLAPLYVKESLEIIGDISSSIIESSDFVTEINRSSNVEDCRALLEETLLKKLYVQIERIFS
ncbi:transcriptional antiterminator [Desulfosporosinus acidiphilus SJ4]|uniref:Transcriptional antiterminator n=1 Tax=Desulfosporosinus acidiphilus (strain DSM 22704 / JCM 16185 / SJ4) TaxID=646529 RepID=I4D6N2_DESAJ|nr:BglG family transcription antiterminator [Desulfosporosinus acidiphilus]AFM41456.1 transcriptional antiterminator [Desulfosporosinus acidiphilus SJ4]